MPEMAEISAGGSRINKLQLQKHSKMQLLIPKFLFSSIGVFSVEAVYILCFGKWDYQEVCAGNR